MVALGGIKVIRIALRLCERKSGVVCAGIIAHLTTGNLFLPLWGAAVYAGPGCGGVGEHPSPKEVVVEQQMEGEINEDEYKSMRRTLTGA